VLAGPLVFRTPELSRETMDRLAAWNVVRKAMEAYAVAGAGFPEHVSDSSPGMPPVLVSYSPGEPARRVFFSLKRESPPKYKPGVTPREVVYVGRVGTWKETDPELDLTAIASRYGPLRPTWYIPRADPTPRDGKHDARDGLRGHE
jgi:hypothetical protein